MCTRHASNYKLKIFQKIKCKKFSKSTLSASIHSTVYGRPISCRKRTSKKTKYGQPWDIRRRRLKAVVHGRTFLRPGWDGTDTDIGTSKG